MARRKPFDFGTGFDEFEEAFDRFMNEFDQYMSEFDESEADGEEPYYYGFSITQRSGEAPEIKEFGSKPGAREVKIIDGKAEAEERKPLIDVFEIGDEVHIVADLPSTKQAEVELYPAEKQVEIRTINAANLSERVELPARVEIKSMRQSFKNGVLEVIFKRKSD